MKLVNFSLAPGNQTIGKIGGQRFLIGRHIDRLKADGTFGHRRWDLASKDFR